MGPGDRRGGMTSDWVWDAFAVEPGGLTEDLRGVRHEATERKRQMQAHDRVYSDWDPGWTLEAYNVCCSASLAWPETRVDVEGGGGRTWSQPSTREQSPF